MLLKKLLRAEELSDAPVNTTAEQLFASSIYDLQMRAQRQQAAALCCAPLVSMSAFETRQSAPSSALDTTLKDRKSCSVEQCVDTALQFARVGKQVLLLVRAPKSVTKHLAAAVSRLDAAMTPELAAECLHCVRLRQCRDVYELLCELDSVQQSWENEAGLQLVALGPLCDLFSGFQTASGITTAGAGLKRMLELAIKRLRATTSIHVILMKTETNHS
ncbi:hypothetical protein GN244_ATG05924 [Phytophthora infestans]|uniref:Uncharacterized protein n=1 Tax=Phytophthora infestans TaxID=4787 RepID=A0A833T1J6_PHYIN|nr:hypothetical protein GN244_ATG05924 [Phytophthora infestans]